MTPTDIAALRALVEKEEWHDIPGVPFYQASSLGNIRSLRRADRNGRVRESKVLKPRTDKWGYFIVNFYRPAKDGRPKHMVRRSVHRLVCMAFHGPPTKERPWALHRDGTRKNNQPDNLYWGTPAENSADMKRHGNSLRGATNPNSPLNRSRREQAQQHAGSGE